MQLASGTITRALSGLATLAMVAALAACTFGGGDPAASASPSASASAPPAASPSPSPAPSTSPASATPPALGTLVVTTQGLLPLTIGEAPGTNPGAHLITFDDDHCYDEDLGLATGDLGRWIANYPAGTGLYGPVTPFAVGVDDTGELWRIDVFDTSLATPEGIHVGSTLGELMEVYPTTLQPGAGYAPVSHVWWIEDEHGYVVFESQNEADYEAEPDIEDTIILIRVIAAGQDPDWGAANSGNVAGACF